MAPLPSRPPPAAAPAPYRSRSAGTSMASERPFEMKIRDLGVGNNGSTTGIFCRSRSHSQSHYRRLQVLDGYDDTTEAVVERLAQMKKQDKNKEKDRQQMQRLQQQQVGIVPNITVVGGPSTVLISNTNISPLPSPDRPSKNNDRGSNGGDLVTAESPAKSNAASGAAPAQVHRGQQGQISQSAGPQRKHVSRMERAQTSMSTSYFHRRKMQHQKQLQQYERLLSARRSGSVSPAGGGAAMVTAGADAATQSGDQDRKKRIQQQLQKQAQVVQRQRQLFDEYTAGTTGKGTMITPSITNSRPTTPATITTAKATNSTPNRHSQAGHMHRAASTKHDLHIPTTKAQTNETPSVYVTVIEGGDDVSDDARNVAARKGMAPTTSKKTVAAVPRLHRVSSPSALGSPSDQATRTPSRSHRSGNSSRSSNRKKKKVARFVEEEEYDDDDDGYDNYDYEDDDDTLYEEPPDRTPRELIAMGAAIDHLCRGGSLEELTDIVEFEITNPVNGTPFLQGGGQNRSLCGHPLVDDTFRDLSLKEYRRSYRRRHHHRRYRNSVEDDETLGTYGEGTVGASFDRDGASETCHTLGRDPTEGTYDTHDRDRTFETYDTSFELDRTFETVESSSRRERTSFEPMETVEWTMEQYRQEKTQNVDDGAIAKDSLSRDTKTRRSSSPAWSTTAGEEGVLEGTEQELHESLVGLPTPEHFAQVAQKYHLDSDDSDDLAASFDDEDQDGDNSNAGISNNYGNNVYLESQEEEGTSQLMSCMMGSKLIGIGGNVARCSSLTARAPAARRILSEENNLDDDNHSWSEGYSMAVNGIARHVQSLISRAPVAEYSVEQPVLVSNIESVERIPTYSSRISCDVPSESFLTLKPEGSFVTEGRSESPQPPVMTRIVSRISTTEEICDHVHRMDISYEASMEAEGIEIPLTEGPRSGSHHARTSFADSHPPSHRFNSSTTVGSVSSKSTMASTPPNSEPSVEAKEDNPKLTRRKRFSSFRRVLWPSQSGSPSVLKTPQELQAQASARALQKMNGKQLAVF